MNPFYELTDEQEEEAIEFINNTTDEEFDEWYQRTLQEIDPE